MTVEVSANVLVARALPVAHRLEDELGQAINAHADPIERNEHAAATYLALRALVDSYERRLAKVGVDVRTLKTVAGLITSHEGRG